MRKFFIGVLILGIAMTVAATWWCLWGRGAHTMLADLDAEHTLAAGEFRHMDRAAQQAMRLLDLLPEKSRPKEATPAAIEAKLGGNPTLAQTWLQWGLDPERGVAVVLDRRLTVPRAGSSEPVPIALIGVTDRSKLQAFLGKSGFQITLGKQVGAVQDVEIGRDPAWMGQRGEDLAVLPIPSGLQEAEVATLRAGFAAFLQPSGSRLGANEHFARLGRDAGDRWLLAWLDVRQLDVLEQVAARRADIAFFAGLFPHAGLWLGDSTGLRVVGSPAGQQVLAEVLKPKRNPPKCGRWFPKVGWAAARASVNLTDIIGGAGKLLPPSTPAELRTALPAATMGLAFVGLSWTELTESFSGHACAGVELASLLGMLRSGPKVTPAWLGAIGVLDGPKADALVERLVGLAKGKAGSVAQPVQVLGHKGWQVDVGPVSVVAARIDDVVVLGPSVAALEAAAHRGRDDSLAATSLADALDGDVVLGFGVDVQPLLDAGRAAMALSGPDGAALVQRITQDFAGQRYAGSRLSLDSDGLLLASAGDPLLQSAAIGALPVLAALAIPNFLRYRDQAKQVEARVELRRIAQAAKQYFETPHSELGGACQFPPSSGPNPPQGCCDPASDKDGDKRCDESAWQAGPTWTALGFGPSGPMRYQFSFTSGGALGAARFTAQAYADLDCSGNVSTFEISGRGRVEPDGSCAAEIDADVRPAGP